ncbi:hypothetical protein MMC29_007133 [Sticta canariensis]|nr:hypothetical protein [Sticta canariensis]
MPCTHLFRNILFKIWICLTTAALAVAQQRPDSRAFIADELETLLVNAGGSGLANAGFAAAITPCTNYVDRTTAQNNNALGRQSAAQWIRTAFHDFATANVAAGTGGLDGSVGYETDRPENTGPGILDSLFFFSFFVNAKATMADLIALGAVISIKSCGGPYVSLRGGRVDATEAGPFGVCEPETDIDSTLSKFKAAGFNQADAIALTACGHSMGGVHHANFPQVVSEAAISTNNADGRAAFDESVAAFDVKVVSEYLSGTGDRGGPLVTTSNKTVQSDLRLYLSDKNVTMQKLSSSADKFASTCSTLVARMIDTVPRGVSLTPVIQPASVKLMNTTLRVDGKGEMKLSGSVRVSYLGRQNQSEGNQQQYLQTSGAAPAAESLQISLIGRSDTQAGRSAQATTSTANVGTSAFGPIRFYDFTLDVPASTGLSGINVLDRKFPLQDSLFVEFSRSSVSPGRAALGTNFVKPITWTVKITAALRGSNTPISLLATFATPITQPGTLNPKMDFSKTARLARTGQAGPFTLYSGVATFEITGGQLFSTSVDITGSGLSDRVEFFKLFNLINKTP